MNIIIIKTSATRAAVWLLRAQSSQGSAISYIKSTESFAKFLCSSGLNSSHLNRTKCCIKTYPHIRHRDKQLKIRMRSKQDKSPKKWSRNSIRTQTCSILKACSRISDDQFFFTKRNNVFANVRISPLAFI